MLKERRDLCRRPALDRGDVRELRAFSGGIVRQEKQVERIAHILVD
jgi:hypothetical protein